MLCFVIVWRIYIINTIVINPTQNDGSSSLVLFLDLPLANPSPKARPIDIPLPVFVYDANPPLLNIFACIIGFNTFQLFLNFISIFFINIKYFIFFTIKKIKNLLYFELNIIGLFRSTVLRVMSPTRFLCATMMVVIVLYPPDLAGTLPLRFNDFLVNICVSINIHILII